MRAGAAAEPFEADEDGAARARGRSRCGLRRAGRSPDLGPRRIVAGAPRATLRPLFAARLLDDDLPPPRPIYVREPDATPMRAGPANDHPRRSRRRTRPICPACTRHRSTMAGRNDDFATWLARAGGDRRARPA